jgi:tripartite-type tricarboxylate transporter receptor subunit TctC
VPTIAEAGYPGVGTMAWQAMFAPGGTPKEVIDTLNKAVIEAMQAPTVKDAFGKQGFNIVPTKTGEEARTWLKGEMEIWKKITDEVKIDLTE